MQSKKTFSLPKNTEFAIGYGIVASSSMGLVVYRTKRGELVWDDGHEQGVVPAEMLGIFEHLWGRLLPGYAYLIDFVERRVHLALQLTVTSFLKHAKRSMLELEWLHYDEEVQDLVEALIAYAENPRIAGCTECQHGYIWIEGLYEFVPCAWCTDAGA